MYIMAIDRIVGEVIEGDKTLVLSEVSDRVSEYKRHGYKVEVSRMNEEYTINLVR